MSCLDIPLPENENGCTETFGNIVGVILPSVRGYIRLNLTGFGFYIVQYKQACYKKGLTFWEVQRSLELLR